MPVNLCLLSVIISFFFFVNWWDHFVIYSFSTNPLCVCVSQRHTHTRADTHTHTHTLLVNLERLIKLMWVFLDRGRTKVARFSCQPFDFSAHFQSIAAATRKWLKCWIDNFLNIVSFSADMFLRPRCRPAAICWSRFKGGNDTFLKILIHSFICDHQEEFSAFL